MIKKYIFLFVVSAFITTGCDLAKNYTKIDREGNMDSQDYRDAFAPRDVDLDDTQAAEDESIPDLMPYVADLADDMEAMPLVTVNLNQSVPLRDALFELAKEAEFDLELDPNIRGSIIFTAKNKPFDLVIQRISDVAGLRYKFEDDSLRIELDSPYTKVYKLDFLNIVRTSESSLTNNISVVSGDGADTGSSFSSDTTSESDFWNELEANISQILNVTGSYNALRTSRDPRLNVAEPVPAPVSETEAVEGGSSAQQAPVAAQQAGVASANPAPPQAVLEVNSLPLDEDYEESNDEDEAEISFSVNKQAGVVLVYAPQKLQKEVKSYLEMIRKTITAQVLIEAKVMEVSLTDEFAAGVNWSGIDLGPDVLLSSQSGDFINGALSGAIRPSFTIEPAPTTNFRLGVVGNDAQTVMDALSRFGTVKALASPRLTVLNNQPAALNVATNVVYFELEIDRTEGTDGQGDTIEIESDIRSVPDGILINVLPSIDIDNRTISMSVRPTVTSIDQFIDDPGFAFAAQGLNASLANRVPQVNVQEIDSVINMRSGQAIIMGGLMQDRTESTQSGVPGLKELPLAGTLFRNQRDEIQKTELVIFLKATIIENESDTIHDTDKDLYKLFSNDRRPFRM